MQDERAVLLELKDKLQLELLESHKVGDLQAEKLAKKLKESKQLKLELDNLKEELKKQENEESPEKLALDLEREKGRLAGLYLLHFLFNLQM